MVRTYLLLASGLALLGAAPVAAQDFSYSGSEYLLNGEGVEVLDPWLADTREGQTIVRTGFRDAADGYVDEEIAHRANIWFRRYADTDGDLMLTDAEIRLALVQASAGHAY